MKVLLSIPNIDGWIHKHVLMAAVDILRDKRHQVTMIMPTNSPYEHNLHKIVIDFVNGDFDYWMSMDADNPPMKNPLDLLVQELDILGLPTPVYHHDGKHPGERPMYHNAYDFVSEEKGYKEHLPKEGLQEVDAIGTGCFIISHRVFENPEMRKAPFQRIWNEDGTVEKGNDIAFCERAKKQGFRIFAHFEYPCRHFNEIELNEVAQAFHAVYT